MAIETQTLSTELIKPSTPTPTQHETHNITFFDQLALQKHTRLVLFYSFDPTISLENLQKSLSDTLSVYPPFAGRFKEDVLAISCKDQGVPFIKVQVNDQLAEILPKAKTDPNLLNALIPQVVGEVKSVTTPTLFVQATLFRCGGLALGIASSHALADGYSWTNFFNHWSMINRQGGLHEAILPDFKLPDHFPATLLPIKLPVGKPSFLKSRATTNVNKTLVFTAEAISSLKAEVASSGINGRVSRVAVVGATIWKALIHTSRVKNGYLRPSLLPITFNFRGRNVLIPNNAFGNVHTRVLIRFQPDHSKNDDDDDDDGEVELHHLVSLIVNGLQSNTLAFSKASTSEEIASLVLSRHNEVKEEMMNEEVDVFPLSSLCNFPFLDVDFGWGKPIWVYKFINMVAITLMDTKCGNGIEAIMNLNETDMTEFVRDPNIKPFILPSH